MKRNFKTYIVIAIMLVTLILLIKNHLSYSDLKKVTSTPFKTIEILGQKINLNNNERTYSQEIDCSSLKSDNDQIINYSFNDHFKYSTISITSKVFSDNTITNDYKDVTSIDINISVKDSKNKYEQIYHINAICYK